MYLTKRGVQSRSTHTTEYLLTGISGAELVSRIKEYRDIQLNIYNPITKQTDNGIPEFCITINLELDGNRVSKYIMITHTSKAHWKILFYDSNSKTPVSKSSYYSNNNGFKAWSRVSSKFEDKVFVKLIDFIDNGVMP